MRAEAAKILRGARTLMNNGGRHWIKGTEEAWIDPETHEPGGRVFTYGPKKGMEEAFCMIGGIYRVGGNADLWEDADPDMQNAVIALATVIDPKQMERARKNAEKSYEQDVKKGYWNPKEDGSKTYYIRHDIVGTAEGIITSNNDNPKTTWEDVSGWLTAAARKLR